MLFWHVPAPNEALLISGSKRHKDATQFRIVTGHGSFVVPVKQRARVLSLALREAAAATKVTLLEPIDEISVLVPDDFVGAVMGDLSSRRGRVLGTETAGHERTVVRAEVPQVELTRYAIDLRSLAHGAASFTRSFVRYEPMPESAAARVKTSA